MPAIRQILNMESEMWNMELSCPCPIKRLSKARTAYRASKTKSAISNHQSEII